MSKTKSLALILGVLILSFLIGYLVFAWTEPSLAPPGCTPGTPGCDAPINVGPFYQEKVGAGIGAASFFDSDDTNWWVDPAGGAGGDSAHLAGDVGIGTTTPIGKFHINLGTPGVGYFRITNDVNTIAVLGDNTSPNDRGILFLYYNGSPTTIISSQGNSYFNGGNVGIGTTTPGQKLDVNGALRLRPSSTPTAANGVVYYDSTSNKFRCYENGAWIDCIGGGMVSYWTQSGSNLYPNDTGWNVGIGTTSPGAKLHSYSSGTPAIFQTTNAANVNVLQLLHPDTGWYFHVDASDHPELGILDVAAATTRWNALDFDKGTGYLGVGMQASSTNRLSVGGNTYISGNVGIGTTTPGQKLDVNGALRLRPGSTPTAANGVIYYDSPLNKFRCYENGAWVDCIGAAGVGAPTNASYIVLGINDELTAERVLIAGSGLASVDGGANGDFTLNVGAGTGISVAADSVGLSYPTKSCGAGTAIQAFDVGGSAAPTCIGVGGAGLWTDAGTYIYPNNYTSLAITDTGRLGIGTTSPAVRLDVAGTAYIDNELRITESSPQIRFEDTDHEDYWIHVNSNRLYFLWDELDDGDWDSPHPLSFLGRSAYFDSSTLVVDAINNRVGIGTTSPTQALEVQGHISVDSWDNQYRSGYASGGYPDRRVIGGAHGWDSGTLYINGWNDWPSGVSIGSSSSNSHLNYTGGLYQGGTRGVPSPDLRPSYWRASNTNWSNAATTSWTDVNDLSITLTVNYPAVLFIFFSGEGFNTVNDMTVYKYASYRIAVGGSIMVPAVTESAATDAQAGEYAGTPISINTMTTVSSGTHTVKVQHWENVSGSGGFWLYDRSLIVLAFRQ